eukprot:364558-Chlamydomonas_euryale.AAC.12
MPPSSTTEQHNLSRLLLFGSPHSSDLKRPEATVKGKEARLAGRGMDEARSRGASSTLLHATGKMRLVVLLAVEVAQV